MDILIIEDDGVLAGNLASSLTEVGHSARIASSRAQARELVEARVPEIAVLDRLLPDGEGLELIPWLREHYPSTAVLVLSALVTLDARVDGLNAGADDYLGKPYAFDELLARIRALKRRLGDAPTVLRAGNLTLDRLRRKTSAAGEELQLNKREFALLEFLMLHRGQTVSRTMVLRDALGFEFEPAANVVDVYVSRLRRKLDENGCAGMLTTERGVGYRLGDARP